MKDLRLHLACSSGRLARWLSRRLGTGGGTAISGLVTSRLDRQALAKLARQAQEGVVLVTGTNGKTTITRMLAAILRRAGLQVVSNSAGANMAGGLTAALLDLPAAVRRGSTIAVLEVDEAWTPRVVIPLRPRRLIVHNFSRDQLDRYGELDIVRTHVANALQALPSRSGLVVLNADDPAVAHLTVHCDEPPLFYGIQDPAMSQQAEPSEANDCPSCGGPLDYALRYFGQMGVYACSQCSFARPRPQVLADHVIVDDWEGAQCHLIFPGGEVTLHLPVSGLYNVYNALAAAATALSLNIPAEAIEQALREFHPAFGRGQRLRLADKNLYLLLVKNPLGFNQVIQLIVHTTGIQEAHLLILINDYEADGRDISWLWDVNLEALVGRINSVFLGGTRALDMALRLKYANLDPGRMVTLTAPAEAFQAAWAGLPRGGTLYVLPTYTALLALHEHLTRRGHLSAFWQGN